MKTTTRLPMTAPKPAPRDKTAERQAEGALELRAIFAEENALQAAAEAKLLRGRLIAAKQEAREARALGLQISVAGAVVAGAILTVAAIFAN